MNTTLQIEHMDAFQEVKGSNTVTETELSRTRRAVRNLGEIVTSENNAVRYIIGQALVDFTYPERSILTRSEKGS